MAELFILFLISAVLWEVRSHLKRKKQQKVARKSWMEKREVARVKAKNTTNPIPSEVVELALDETVQELIEGKLAKYFNDDTLLKKNERLIFSIPNVTLAEERSVGVKGKTSGASYRLSKKVTVRAGGFNAKPVIEMKSIDNGSLVLTNKQFIFNGRNRTKNIPLRRINKISHVSDGMALNIEGKQRSEHYLGVKRLNFKLKISPTKPEEKWDEEFRYYYMTAGEVNRIVKGLLTEAS